MGDDASALLVRAGLITADALELARAHQAHEGGTIGEHLVATGMVSDERLTEFYRTRLLVAQVHPNTLARLDPAIIGLLSADLASELRAVPVALDKDGNLTVAMSDPSDRQALDELTAHTGKYVVRAVATQMQIAWCLAQYYDCLTDLGERLLQPTAAPAPAPAPAPTPAPAPAAPVPESVPPRVGRSGDTGKIEASRHRVLAPVAAPRPATEREPAVSDDHDEAGGVAPGGADDAPATAVFEMDADEPPTPLPRGAFGGDTPQPPSSAWPSSGPRTGFEESASIIVSAEATRPTRLRPALPDPPELFARAGELTTSAAREPVFDAPTVSIEINFGDEPEAPAAETAPAVSAAETAPAVSLEPLGAQPVPEPIPPAVTVAFAGAAPAPVRLPAPAGAAASTSHSTARPTLQVPVVPPPTQLEHAPLRAETTPAAHPAPELVAPSPAVLAAPELVAPSPAALDAAPPDAVPRSTAESATGPISDPALVAVTQAGPPAVPPIDDAVPTIIDGDREDDRDRGSEDDGDRGSEDDREDDRDRGSEDDREDDGDRGSEDGGDVDGDDAPIALVRTRGAAAGEQDDDDAPAVVHGAVPATVDDELVGTESQPILLLTRRSGQIAAAEPGGRPQAVVIESIDDSSGPVLLTDRKRRREARRREKGTMIGIGAVSSLGPIPRSHEPTPGPYQLPPHAAPEPTALAAVPETIVTDRSLTVPVREQGAFADEAQPTMRTRLRFDEHEALDDGWGAPGTTIPPGFLGAVDAIADDLSVPVALTDDADRNARLTPAPATLTPANRNRAIADLPDPLHLGDLLAEASQRLVELLSAFDQAGHRDHVVAMLVDFVSESHHRVAFLALRGDELLPFMQVPEPAGPPPRLALSAAATFQDVIGTRLPYRGPISDPASRELVKELFGSATDEMLLVPVAVKDRVVGVIYADGRHRHSFDEHVSVAGRAAGLALERILMTRKA